jgi:hypothetical protein
MTSIEYAKNLPLESVDLAREFFENHGQTVHVRVRENRTLNVGEWALPALLTVWVAKSFFDGFFKELGKESGAALKGLLNTLYSRVSGVNNRFCDATALRQIADGAPPESLGCQGPALRLVVSLETTDSQHTTGVSFVVPDGLTEVEIEIATSRLVGGLESALDQQQELLDEHLKSLRPTSLIYSSEDGWMTDWERIEKEAKAARIQGE